MHFPWGFLYVVAFTVFCQRFVCGVAGGCASPVAHDGAADLVPVAQWAPDVVQDMRYFGAENFVGRPVAGLRGATVLAESSCGARLERGAKNLAIPRTGVESV